MGYKDLKNFQGIFEREDFNYISDSNIMDEICRIILSISTSLKDYQKTEYVKRIKKFLDNLTYFYEFLTNSRKKRKVDNSEIDKSYTIIYGTLASCVRLFSEPDERRGSISKNYQKKFNKDFIYGLTQLLKGIRNAFEPENISSTGINRDQLVRYILEKKEGLGKKFQFNNLGRFAFVQRIGDLEILDLILVAKLLLRPSKRQIRTINGWRDLGSQQDTVRILCIHKRLIIKKDRVYYLFRLSEHAMYEKEIHRLSPNEAFFKAA